MQQALTLCDPPKEIIPEAIDDARANAERNGIKNVEFFVGKAEEVLEETASVEDVSSENITNSADTTTEEITTEEYDKFKIYPPKGKIFSVDEITIF